MSWRVGVACVGRMGSWWITYFFIVLWQLVPKIFFSSLLGWSGLFQNKSGTFYFHGGIGLGNILLLSGIWSPLVWNGLCGLNAIGVSLRSESVPRASWLRVLLLLYISGLVVGFTSSSSLVSVITDLGLTSMSTLV